MTRRHPTVLVVGAPLAGVDGVVAALRARLPEASVLSCGRAPDRPPDAVVAVVSAVAPLTRSDWTLVQRASSRTAVVVAAVSKIDAHRRWRDVMAADRARVGRWDGRAVSWVGVAAAPDLGDASVDELVAVLRERLAHPVPSGAARRGRLLHARLRLLRLVRDRTAAMRTELRAAAAAVPVGGTDAFIPAVEAAAARFDRELDDEITRALARPAAEPRRLRPAELGRPPSSAGALEGRLTTVLGVGFGLGIAVASSRLVAEVAPGLSVAGVGLGGAVGVAVVVWVIRARRLLLERARLDRWVAEVAATVRWHGEAVVAERLLDAEFGGTIDGVLDEAAEDPKDVTDQYEW